MPIKRLILPFYFIALAVSQLSAQDEFQAGLLPSINLNKSLSEQYSLNFKGESRLLATRPVNEKPKPIYYQLTDVSLLVARKVGIGNVLSAGYLYRSRPESHAHRLIQQFTIVRVYQKYRLAHRFASDQTFDDGDDVLLRMRYRITAEIPLNGERVNKNEFYLKLNNEYLNTNLFITPNSIEGDPDLEVRIIPLVGYLFDDNNKLEAGIDYRVDGIINYLPITRMWFTAGWFLKF